MYADGGIKALPFRIFIRLLEQRLFYMKCFSRSGNHDAYYMRHWVRNNRPVLIELGVNQPMSIELGVNQPVLIELGVNQPVLIELINQRY